MSWKGRISITISDFLIIISSASVIISSAMDQAVAEPTTQSVAAAECTHLQMVSSCCCRHAVLPEQAPGAADSRASPTDGGEHPLADTASQAKHDRASSDALASGSVAKDQSADSSNSSRQAVGLSQELIDLFDSIQQLQQQVAALLQPQQISPAAGAQPGPSSDQVPLLWSVTPGAASLCTAASVSTHV